MELGEAWAQLLTEIVVLDHGKSLEVLVAQALFSAFEVQTRVAPPSPPTAVHEEDEDAITIYISAESISVDAGDGTRSSVNRVEDLPRILPGGSKDRMLIFRSDPGISYHQVIRVLDMAKREEYHRIQFGVSSPN